MKKRFLSWALALVALVFVSIPQAMAEAVNVQNVDELYQTLCQGKKPNGSALAEDDVITLTKDIAFTVEGNVKYYLYVLQNTTRTIDLNGHTLRHDCASDMNNFVVRLYDNSTLNVYDNTGKGQIVCNTLRDFSANDVAKYKLNNTCLWGVSHSVFEMSEGDNSVLNIYGGNIKATINNVPTQKTSVIMSCKQSHLLPEDISDLNKFNTNTINIYGGQLSSIKNTYSMPFGSGSNVALFSNKKVEVNLFGGTLGENGSDYPGLAYRKGFKGILKDGTIYGIESDDHLYDFQAVPSGVVVYVNGTQTTIDALKTQDLSDKTVRFEYAPDITVAGQAVTKNNCDDILPGEEYKISFDYSTNTLYLKSLGTKEINTITGNINYSDFTLNIVVDGKWRLNGRIVGFNGNLVISAAHQALLEEDADYLGIHANSTPVSLNGKSFCAKHRVAVYIDDNNKYSQSAVSCGTFVINNAWFDAWGKKPVVDCQNSMIQNATIKNGSLKDNEVVQIEPNIQKYILILMKNIDEAGKLYDGAGKEFDGGTYPEGMDVTFRVAENSGYKFLRWDDNSEKMQRTITMKKDLVLTAIFEPEEEIRYFNVNVVSADENMGTVSGGGTNLQEGTGTNISATPKSGYEFLYWMDSKHQVISNIASQVWKVTGDETLTAYFRVKPDPNDYLMWVCGTQVSTTNASDILGDGVWLYDHDSRTLITMKDANYNLTMKDFMQDWITDAGPLTMVINHNITVTTDDTEATSISSGAILSTKGLTIHVAKNKRLNLTAKNMYPLQANGTGLKIEGHGRVDISLQNTNDKAMKAMLLSGDPALTVDGAWMFVNVPSGCKVSNTTDAKLSVLHGEALGSMSDVWLEIHDLTPTYSVNMTPAHNMDLCVYSGAGDYFEGEIVTLRALPATGYKFVAWSDGNTDNPRTFTMPAYDLYIDPIVEQDESIGGLGAIINVNATEGQGSITGFTSGWYAEGTELTITAVAADGYKFVEWSDGTTDNPYHLTVVANQNINITACFQPVNQQQGLHQTTNDQLPMTNKILLDGVLYLKHNGTIYDVQGKKIKK